MALWFQDSHLTHSDCTNGWRPVTRRFFGDGHFIPHPVRSHRNRTTRRRCKLRIDEVVLPRMVPERYEQSEQTLKLCNSHLLGIPHPLLRTVRAQMQVEHKELKAMSLSEIKIRQIASRVKSWSCWIVAFKPGSNSFLAARGCKWCRNRSNKDKRTFGGTKKFSWSELRAACKWWCLAKHSEDTNKKTETFRGHFGPALERIMQLECTPKPHPLSWAGFLHSDLQKVFDQVPKPICICVVSLFCGWLIEIPGKISIYGR